MLGGLPLRDKTAELHIHFKKLAHYIFVDLVVSLVLC